MDIVAAFSTYGSCVEREAELREGVQGAVKDLEKTSYAISTNLEKIHNTQGIQVLMPLPTLAYTCLQYMLKRERLAQQISQEITFVKGAQELIR